MEILFWVFVGLASLAVAALIVGLIIHAMDYATGKTVNFPCKVLHLDYTPGSTGIGPTVGGNGGGVAVTYHDERWTLIVSVAGGPPEPLSVTRESWGKTRVGDEFMFPFRVGGISGDRL